MEFMKNTELKTKFESDKMYYGKKNWKFKVKTLVKNLNNFFLKKLKKIREFMKNNELKTQFENYKMY